MLMSAELCGQQFIHVYMVYTGICVHAPTAKCMLSLAVIQTCGHGAVATSPLLGTWMWPSPSDIF